MADAVCVNRPQGIFVFNYVCFLQEETKTEFANSLHTRDEKIVQKISYYLGDVFTYS